MQTNTHSRAYDFFKLIVALVLLIILILVWRCTPLPKVVVPQPLPATAEQNTAPSVLPTQIPVPTASPAPSATQAPSAVPTLAPTPTVAASPTPQPTSTQTVAAPPTEKPSPTTQPVAAGAVCPANLPSRLKIGDTARVITNLNLRTSAGIANNNLILVHPAETRLKIMAGPECPTAGGTYVWWNVLDASGKSGWSAEVSLDGGLYLMAPVLP